MMSRLFLPRAVMGLVMLGYLFVIISSHWIPLSSALEAPLALAGWLALALLFVVFSAGWIVDWLDSGRDMSPWWPRWSVVMHLAFAAAVVLAFYFASTGNLSLACPEHATSCVKTDNWKMSGGRYYRQSPYDSAGNDDPGAAWVEISRPVYVAEVGTRLRQPALFGVVALCIAWVLYGADERWPEPGGSSRRAGWRRWRRPPGRTGAGGRS